jgi:hypothetical protein
LKRLGLPVRHICAVSVDSRFWHPEPEDMDDILNRFGLEKGCYVLTSGGTARDEIFGAKVAKILNLTYVRASMDFHTIERARSILSREGLANHVKILFNPSDVELRSLYSGAYVVCLPTLTKTNPAGLTSLVVAMACGAVVAVPDTIAKGYVEEGTNGIILHSAPKIC